MLKPVDEFLGAFFHCRGDPNVTPLRVTSRPKYMFAAALYLRKRVPAPDG